MKRRFRTLGLLIPGFAVFAACNRPQSITIDFSAHPVRFIINHEGWPRPFRIPRITELAIANKDDDAAVWELHSADGFGVAADQLAVIYGEPPKSFTQSFPEANAKPEPLAPGKTYYLAAAGPSALYSMVFSMPRDARELRIPRAPARSN